MAVVAVLGVLVVEVVVVLLALLVVEAVVAGRCCGGSGVGSASVIRNVICTTVK